MDAISCLAPPPAALLPTSFADAAIARALHSSSSSSATTTTIISPDSASSHHNHLFPVPPHAASCHPVRHNHHHHQALALAPAGARAGKRRSRASKRAPTTYISTDAANFRLMVQQITGAQAADDDVVAGVEDVTMLQVQAAALLGAAAGNPQLLPVPVPGDDEASALRRHQLHRLELQQQQQQPCFPTLDSWNVMYETNSSAGTL